MQRVPLFRAIEGAQQNRIAAIGSEHRSARFRRSRAGQLGVPEQLAARETPTSGPELDHARGGPLPLLLDHAGRLRGEGYCTAGALDLRVPWSVAHGGGSDAACASS